MALGKPSEKVAPPQKVIKALVSKRSNNPQELSYVKGDFWYVTGERDEWFEALSEWYISERGWATGKG
jgi:bud emergence protein 1